MAYSSERHSRRSLRLPAYDYSWPGAYFVTVCTKQRRCLLGAIREGRLVLNEAGSTVYRAWTGLAERWPQYVLDAFVVMPNHVHAVLMLGSDTGVTLGEVVRRLKAASTLLIHHQGLLDFAWQRNYHEHIIRSDESLLVIRRYIASNPQMWPFDVDNPDRVGGSPADLARLAAASCGCREDELGFLAEYATNHSGEGRDSSHPTNRPKHWA